MSAASDFDFFIGDWRVEHRRLKERLAGCTDWDVFAGTTSTRKILGGMGNCDDNHLELPGDPYCALTVRTFDPASNFVKDTFKGKPIVVRFLWRVLPDGTPRWEQAFSPDDGTTWETNWTMEFKKAA